MYLNEHGSHMSNITAAHSSESFWPSLELILISEFMQKSVLWTQWSAHQTHMTSNRTIFPQQNQIKYNPTNINFHTANIKHNVQRLIWYKMEIIFT